MLRLAGAVLLTGGGAALGLCAAARLTGRVRAIGALLEALEDLERELSFRLASMPELLSRAARARPPAGEFFRACLAGLEQLGEKSLEEIWDEALPAAGDLGEHPADILRSLGGVLGRYDGERQRESISAACLALRRCLAEAEAERKRLGKVYGALGTVAGALLAILLL